MKKIYMMPLTEVTKIHTQKVIAASPFVLNAQGDVESGKLINEDATSEGLSRRSIWDDDEDDFDE